MQSDRGTAMIVNSEYSGFSVSEFHSAGRLSTQITALLMQRQAKEVPSRVKAVRVNLYFPQDLR